jgi:DNA-binding transcriptional LysR family regulator
MHFDLVDLRLFVCIAEENSLTRGAAKANLSAPAASQRLKNLEQALGSGLFERSSQGLTLLPAGHALLHHARQVARQLESLRGELKEYATGVKGHLRVLVNASAMTDHFPHVLRTFLIEHPEVNIDLKEKLSSEIVRALVDGRADLGIVAGNVHTEGLQVIPYRRDRLVLVTARRHPLSSHDKVVFAETLDYDFVGLQEGSAIQNLLEQCAGALQRRILMRIQLGSYEMICRMIEAGIGVGILPESAARRYVDGFDIRMVPLADTWSASDLLICTRDMQALPPFGRQLIDLLVDEADGGGRCEVPVEYS